MRTLKKTLCLVLAVVMILGLGAFSVSAKTTGDYTDAAEIKDAEAVDVLSTIGVLEGFDTGDFQPNGTLTRAEAAKIITSMLGVTTVPASTPFTDVPDGHWAHDYIAYCAAQGIIAGYGDGTFGPSDKLTGGAFAKMLLTALGYDAEIEGLVNNSSWLINVAKLVRNTDLDDGIANFPYDEEIIREDAARLALNAIKTPLVQYGNTTTVKVNDASVTVGGATASYVTTTAAKEQNISSAQPSNSQSYFVEFGERYIKDLTLNSGATDDFYRPSNAWAYKNQAIGTYPVEAEISYTGTVKNGRVYTDLGLGSSVPASRVTVYVDGAQAASSVALSKGGDSTIGESGTGVLTEVYKQVDDNGVVSYDIIQVNTYVGDVQRVVAATASADAYIEIARDSNAYPNGAVNGMGGKAKFETDEEFAAEDVVLYTWSYKDGKGIVSAQVAETVEGIATETQNKRVDGVASVSVTLDDDVVYNAAKKFAGIEVGTVTIKGTYEIVLDPYGNMIRIKEIDALSNNYALVLDIQGANGGAFLTNQARLLTSDGSIVVANTAKDYTTGSNQVAQWDIVTYTKSDSNVYTLKAVDANKQFNETGLDQTTGAFLVNSRAAITLPTYPANANSTTVFVVAESNSGLGKKPTAYTGIKNAPNVTAKAALNTVDVYYYAKNSNMATVMFILVGNLAQNVKDASSKGIFLAKGSASNLINDYAGNSYFTYNAVVDGKIQEVKVDGSLGKDLGGIYRYYTINSKGIISDLDEGFVSKSDVTVTNGTATTTTSDYDSILHGFDIFTTGASAQYLLGTGISKTSEAYTATLGTQSRFTGTSFVGSQARTLTFADDAKIYYVDSDQNIEETTYGALVPDDDDWVYAQIDDYVINTLYVADRKDGSAAPLDTIVGGTKGTLHVVSGSYSIVTDTFDELIVDDTATKLTITGTLTITGDATINGPVDVDGGHLVIGGKAVFKGHTDVKNSGTIQVNGKDVTSEVTGNSLVITSGNVSFNGPLTVSGKLTLTAGGLRLADELKVTNNANAVVTIAGGTATVLGAVENGGTIAVTGGTTVLDSSVDNDGKITVATGTLSINGTTDNDGSIAVASGTFAAQTIDNAAGATVKCESGATTSATVVGNTDSESVSGIDGTAGQKAAVTYQVSLNLEEGISVSSVSSNIEAVTANSLYKITGSGSTKISLTLPTGGTYGISADTVAISVSTGDTITPTVSGSDITFTQNNDADIVVKVNLLRDAQS